MGHFRPVCSIEIWSQCYFQLPPKLRSVNQPKNGMATMKKFKCTKDNPLDCFSYHALLSFIKIRDKNFLRSKGGILLHQKNFLSPISLKFQSCSIPLSWCLLLPSRIRFFFQIICAVLKGHGRKSSLKGYPWCI